MFIRLIAVLLPRSTASHWLQRDAACQKDAALPSTAKPALEPAALDDAQAGCPKAKLLLLGTEVVVAIGVALGFGVAVAVAVAVATLVGLGVVVGVGLAAGVGLNG